MSEQKRKKWTAAEKLRIVLTSMQPGVEVSALCRREGVNPTQFYDWKKRLLGSAEAVFDRLWRALLARGLVSGEAA